MARRGRRTQWLSAALLAASGLAQAAPPPSAPPPEAVAPATAAPAGAALLDYLSEFEDAQGEWIDPSDLPSAESAPQEDDDAR